MIGRPDRRHADASEGDAPMPRPPPSPSHAGRARPSCDPRPAGAHRVRTGCLRDNNGDANVGFWFLQDPTVGCTAIDPPGTGGGSTASFTGDHVDGDLLVVSEFTNGGVVNAINVYQWDGDAGGALNTMPIASAADCASASPGDLKSMIFPGSFILFITNSKPWHV